MRFASGSCSCNFPVALVFVFTTRNQKRFTIKVLRADKWANLKSNVLPSLLFTFPLPEPSSCKRTPTQILKKSLSLLGT